MSTTVDDGTPQNAAFVYDAAGNLVFDQRFVNFYDGLNRLMQIHAPAAPPTFDAAGAPTSAPGLIVAQYTYDGLGRLIHKEFLAGREEDAQNPGTYFDHYATAHFFYDGSRRIQEAFVYPPATADFLWPAGAPHAADEIREHEYVYGPDYVDEFICQITPDDL